MNHEAAYDLLSDFALTLLDPAEAEAVLAHVRQCDECREELDLLGYAAGALSLAAEPVELPAGAVPRIMLGVRGRLMAEAAPTAISARSASPAVVTGFPWRPVAVGAAAAVAAVSVGLAASLTAWRDADNKADRLEGQLASAALELPLKGQGAGGMIFVASNFEEGVAHLEGLGPAPQQHHYEIWTEGPKGIQRVTSFGSSTGDAYVRLPALPREMTRMFVTIEPDAAASTQPSGPVVLSTP